MKKCFLFVFLFFLCHAGFTQPTQAEIEAMQKKLQKQIDSIINDPLVKKNMKNQDAGLSKSNTGLKNPPNNQVINNDPEKIKLPAPDSGRIKSIPKKSFSLQELNTYIANLHTILTKKLSPQAVNSANEIAAKLGNDSKKIEEAALLGMHNGAIEEAVLLITKLASRSSDGILLTNAGAILDVSGLSEKAIPILRTVVSYSPQNTTALNNLGQAFTTIGMKDSALHYFSRCLSLSSQHPEANNTAGVIELQKGNKVKAQQHFENSIRGGFNISAYNGLKSILKDKCRIAHLVKPKVKLPEYFNQFKYKLPRQCLNVYEASTVEEEFKAFSSMINNVMQKYRKQGKEAEQKMETKFPEMNKILMNKVSKGQSPIRPFQTLGNIMEGETIIEYRKDREDLAKFNKDNRQQYEQLELEYKIAFEKIQHSEADEGCEKEIELKNKYLPRFAQLNEEWQSRYMLIENKYIDDLLFWCYFSAFDMDDYRARFYTWVYNYLYRLNWLAQVKILEPCEVQEPEEIEKAEEKELQVMDCPVKLSISFAVGKLQVDCQEFSFKAGEGIIFRIGHNFITKQSTWSVGLGTDLYGLPITAVKGEIDAKIHMSVFITLDQYGNVADGGLVSEAKATADFEFAESKKFKFKEAEAGWRLGYNTGLNLNPGILKDVIDKTLGPEPEVQKNKNIKIYKSNN